MRKNLMKRIYVCVAIILILAIFGVFALTTLKQTPIDSSFNNDGDKNSGFLEEGDSPLAMNTPSGLSTSSYNRESKVNEWKDIPADYYVVNGEDEYNLDRIGAKSTHHGGLPVVTGTEFKGGSVGERKDYFDKIEYNDSSKNGGQKWVIYYIDFVLGPDMEAAINAGGAYATFTVDAWFGANWPTVGAGHKTDLGSMGVVQFDSLNQMKDSMTGAASEFNHSDNNLVSQLKNKSEAYTAINESAATSNVTKNNNTVSLRLTSKYVRLYIAGDGNQGGTQNGIWHTYSNLRVKVNKGTGILNGGVRYEDGSIANEFQKTKDVYFLVKESNPFSSLSISTSTNAVYNWVNGGGSANNITRTLYSDDANGKSYKYSFRVSTNLIIYQVTAIESVVNTTWTVDVGEKIEYIDGIAPNAPSVELKGSSLGKDNWFLTNSFTYTATFYNSDISGENSTQVSPIENVYLKVSVNKNGVYEIYDGKSKVLVSANTPISSSEYTDGIYELVFWSEDGVGNKSNEVKRAVKIDSATPVISLTPQGKINEWNKENIIFNISNSATSNVSGTAFGAIIKDYVNNGNSSSTGKILKTLSSNQSFDYTISTSQFADYTFFIENGAGVRVYFSDLQKVKIDKSTPVFNVTHGSSNFMDGAWVNNKVDFIFSLKNPGASPSTYDNKKINYFYSLDNGVTWEAISNTDMQKAKFTADSPANAFVDRAYMFKAETVTGVEYIFTDETIGETFDVKIDKVIPVVSFTAKTNGEAYIGGSWASGNIILEFTIVNINDIKSGFDSIYISENQGASWTKIITNVSMLNYTITTLTNMNKNYIFKVESKAGNINEDYNNILNAKIDNSVAYFDLRSIGYTFGNWTNSNININFALSRTAVPISGYTIEYIVTYPDGSEEKFEKSFTTETSYNNFIQFAQEGEYKIDIKATTGSGLVFKGSSQGATGIYIAKIDKTADSFSFSQEDWNANEDGIKYITNEEESLNINNVTLSNQLSPVNYIIEVYSSADLNSLLFTDSVTINNGKLSYNFTNKIFNGYIILKAIDSAGNKSSSYLGEKSTDKSLRLICDSTDYEFNFVGFNSAKGSVKLVSGNSEMNSANFYKTKVGEKLEFSAVASEEFYKFIEFKNSGHNVVDNKITIFVAFSETKTQNIQTIFKSIVAFDKLSNVYQQIESFTGNFLEISGVVSIENSKHSFADSATGIVSIPELSAFSIVYSVFGGDASLENGKPKTYGIYTFNISVNTENYIGDVEGRLIITRVPTAELYLNKTEFAYNSTDRKTDIVSNLVGRTYIIDNDGNIVVNESAINMLINFASLGYNGYADVVFKQNNNVVVDIKNAGSYVIEIVSTFDSGNNRPFAINFSQNVEISKANITLTGVTTLISKEYDGNVNFNYGTSFKDYLIIDGLYNNEDLGLNLTEFAFSDKNANNSLNVHINGISITNTNYILNNTSVSLNGKINKKQVSLENSSEIFNKVYDGNTDISSEDLLKFASIGKYISVNEIVAGESLTLNIDGIRFTEKTAKQQNLLLGNVSIVDSNNLSNYEIINSETFELLGNINKKMVNNFIFSNMNKVFDGKNISKFGLSVEGLIDGENTDVNNNGIPDILENAYTQAPLDNQNIGSQGRYSITFDSEIENYTIIQDNYAIFTINKKQIKVNPWTADVTNLINAKYFDNTQITTETINYISELNQGMKFKFTVFDITNKTQSAYTMVDGYTLEITLTVSRLSEGKEQIKVTTKVLNNGAVDLDNNYAVTAHTNTQFIILARPIEIITSISELEYTGSQFRKFAVRDKNLFTIIDKTTNLPISKEVAGNLLDGVIPYLSMVDSNGAFPVTVGNYLWKKDDNFNLDSSNFTVSVKSTSVSIVPQKLTITVTDNYDTNKFTYAGARSAVASILVKNSANNPVNVNDYIKYSWINNAKVFGDVGVYNVKLISTLNENYKILNIDENGIVYKNFASTLSEPYQYEVVPMNVKLVQKMIGADYGYMLTEEMLDINKINVNSNSFFKWTRDNNVDYSIINGNNLSGNIILTSNGSTPSFGYLDVGVYDFNVSGLSLGDNYTITYPITFTFNIKKKALNVRLTDVAPKVYTGQAITTLPYDIYAGSVPYTWVNGINPFNINVYLENAINVGQHNIFIEKSVNSSYVRESNNYELGVPEKQTISITPALATVTVERKDGSTDMFADYSADFNIYTSSMFKVVIKGAFEDNILLNTSVDIERQVIGDTYTNYNLVPRYSLLSNYTVTDVKVPFKVNKAKVNINSNASLDYGDSVAVGNMTIIEEWFGLAVPTLEEKAKLLTLINGKVQFEIIIDSISANPELGIYQNVLRVKESSIKNNEYYYLDREQSSNEVAVTGGELFVSISDVETIYGEIINENYFLNVVFRFKSGTILENYSEYFNVSYSINIINLPKNASDTQYTIELNGKLNVEQTSFFTCDENSIPSSFKLKILPKAITVNVKEENTKVYDNNVNTDVLPIVSLDGDSVLGYQDSLSDIVAISRENNRQVVGIYKYALTQKSSNYTVVSNIQNVTLNITPAIVVLSFDNKESFIYGNTNKQIIDQFKFSYNTESRTLIDEINASVSYNINNLNVNNTSVPNSGSYTLSYIFKNSNILVKLSSEDTENIIKKDFVFDIEKQGVKIYINNKEYSGDVSLDFTGNYQPLDITFFTLDNKELKIETQNYSVNYNGSTQSPMNAGEYKVNIAINENYLNYKAISEFTYTINKVQLYANDVIFNSNKKLQYTGNELKLKLDLSLNNPYKITYVYYDKDKNVIESPIGVGKYSVTAEINMMGQELNYLPTTKTSDYEIIKAKYDASKIISSNTQTQKYNKVTGVQNILLPEEIKYTVKYYNSTDKEWDSISILSADVGTYLCDVEIDNENYEGKMSLIFIISKSEWDSSVNTWIDANENGGKYSYTFIFNKEAKNVAINEAGLVEKGIKVSYRNGDNLKNVSTYTVYADFTSTNYVDKQIQATVTITSWELDIDIDKESLVQVYDGKEKKITATNKQGEVVNYSIQYNKSISKPIVVGDYTVVVTVNETNYTGTATVVLKVTPQKISTQLMLESKEYNGSAFTAEFKTKELISGETLPTLSYAYKIFHVTLNEQGEEVRQEVAQAVNAGKYVLEVSFVNPNYYLDDETRLESFTININKTTSPNMSVASVTNEYSGRNQSIDTKKLIFPDGIGIIGSVEYKNAKGNKATPKNVGVYTMSMIIGGMNHENREINATLEIKPKNVIIEVEEITQEQVTLKIIDGALYRVNGGEWQSSNVFATKGNKEYKFEIMFEDESMANNINMDSLETKMVKTPKGSSFSVFELILTIGGASIALLGVALMIIFLASSKKKKF